MLRFGLDGPGGWNRNRAVRCWNPASAARLGMECTIYMGAEDVERQAPNVMRMKLLGATVHAVESGTRTLKDAINEALRAWIGSQKTTHYCFGTAAGSHPFPLLVSELRSVIWRETRCQVRRKSARRLRPLYHECASTSPSDILGVN